MVFLFYDYICYHCAVCTVTVHQSLVESQSLCSLHSDCASKLDSWDFLHVKCRQLSNFPLQDNVSLYFRLNVINIPFLGVLSFYFFGLFPHVGMKFKMTQTHCFAIRKKNIQKTRVGKEHSHHFFFNLTPKKVNENIIHILRNLLFVYSKLVPQDQWCNVQWVAEPKKVGGGVGGGLHSAKHFILMKWFALSMYLNISTTPLVFSFSIGFIQVTNSCSPQLIVNSAVDGLIGSNTWQLFPPLFTASSSLFGLLMHINMNSSWVLVKMRQLVWPEKSNIIVGMNSMAKFHPWSPWTATSQAPHIRSYTPSLATISTYHQSTTIIYMPHSWHKQHSTYYIYNNTYSIQQHAHTTTDTYNNHTQHIIIYCMQSHVVSIFLIFLSITHLIQGSEIFFPIFHHFTPLVVDRLFGCSTVFHSFSRPAQIPQSSINPSMLLLLAPQHYSFTIIVTLTYIIKTLIASIMTFINFHKGLGSSPG
ncbi:hypothetical protein VP01_432g4 [Puccinia sorghi]|uniref:Uncharacterized protein n=1 Tax=Puccinia sorghi TaxID=27349 RepID=A0A0L6UPZ7_9BASI|nr:hypothetical protein VP01_432g4 [Puccinia sorghi]